MQLCIKMLGTIFLVYIGMINLNLYQFKIKQILLMIGITEIISSILALFLGKYIALVAILFITILMIYKDNRNIVKSIVLPILSILIIVISDFMLTSVIIYFFNINMDDMSKNLKVHWEIYILGLILVFTISKFLGILVNKKMKALNLMMKGKCSFLIVISSILTIIILHTNTILVDKFGLESDIIKINTVLSSTYFFMLLVIIYILCASAKMNWN